MGLKFTELSEWQRWQDTRRRPQRAWNWLRNNYRHQLRAAAARPESQSAAEIGPETRISFWQRGSAPTVLIALDSTSPSSSAALLAPLTAASHHATGPVIIAAPANLPLQLPAEFRQLDTAELGTVRRVVGIGHHLPIGRWAQLTATSRGWRQIVVQHGILTPFSPPPPPGSLVLAWSQADAHFVSLGRPDLTVEVVGSALLAAAHDRPAPHVSPHETPVFLGQLHGAELGTVEMARTITKFWRLTGAHYQPHPAETNLLSRIQHRLWQRQGMTIGPAVASLRDLGRPSVGIFSTGILEAAALGLPAWGYHDWPPDWVREVWHRYRIARWGEPPTIIDPALTDHAAATRIAAAWFADRP